MELILDMKGVSLKTLTTHSFMNIISTLTKDLVSNYPDCLKSLYMLSTPLFVPDLLDSHLKPLVPAETFAKLILTGENIHPDLPFDMIPASDNSLDQELSDNDEGNVEDEEEIDEGAKMSSK